MPESTVRPLSDERLLSALKHLVSEESRLLSEILEHLREVEARKLFLARGYPSLFEFATTELKYSEGAAQRRISAMRLLKALPEFKEKIACGELSLTNAAQAQGFIRRENLKRREVGMGNIDRETQREIVTEVLGKSKAEAQRVLVNRLPQGEPPREFVRALKDEKSLIQFLASADLTRKLERLRGLLAHSLPNATLSELIERLAEIALDREDPERKALRAKSAKSGPSESALPPSAEAGDEASPPPAERGDEASPPSPAEVGDDGSPPPAEVARRGPRHPRSPRAADRHAVWLRDGGRCTFRDDQTGRTCGSRHAVQYDHLVPYAFGGSTTTDNLALRCAAHNRWRTERVDGRKASASAVG